MEALCFLADEERRKNRQHQNKKRSSSSSQLFTTAPMMKKLRCLSDEEKEKKMTEIKRQDVEDEGKEKKEEEDFLSGDLSSSSAESSSSSPLSLSPRRHRGAAIRERRAIRDKRAAEEAQVQQQALGVMLDIRFPFSFSCPGCGLHSYVTRSIFICESCQIAWVYQLDGASFIPYQWTATAGEKKTDKDEEEEDDDDGEEHDEIGPVTVRGKEAKEGPMTLGISSIRFLRRSGLHERDELSAWVVCCTDWLSALGIKQATQPTMFRNKMIFVPNLVFGKGHAVKRKSQQSSCRGVPVMEAFRLTQQYLNKQATKTLPPPFLPYAQANFNLFCHWINTKARIASLRKARAADMVRAAKIAASKAAPNQPAPPTLLASFP